MPGEKVHDLEQQQVTDTVKRQRLADEVMLVTNQSFQNTAIDHPLQYLQTTNIYLNTLAVGGQKKVVKSQVARDSTGMALEVMFTPYQDAFQLVSFIVTSKTRGALAVRPGCPVPALVVP